MLYIDLHPALYHEGKLHIQRVAATIAHEYQHLIHARYEGEKPQYTFINEGLSELAQIVCGFPPRAAGEYLTHPNRPLLSWDYTNSLPDYARASLFMQYVFEQLGYQHIQALVQTTERGIKALEKVIRTSSSLPFQEMFLNWGKALLMNDRSVDTAYGYKDQRRDSIRFAPRNTYNELPDAATFQLSDLVHIPVSFPLTKKLHLEATDPPPELRLNAVASYPQRPPEPITSQGGGTLTASDDKFSSINLLVSNTHPQNTETDTTTTPYTFLAQGEKSGLTVTKAYDDGLADTFTERASYLLLDGNIDEKYAVAFGSTSGAWLYGIDLKGIFLNELEGSEISAEADRDVQVRIYTWHNGQPQKPLSSPLNHAFQRPLGDLKFERISLLNDYENLSALPDSFCVVVANDGDDANFFAIGMDNSQGGHSYFVKEGNDRWPPMRQYSVEGTQLDGWNAMIRANEVVPQIQIAAIITPRFEVNYPNVAMHFRPPFPIDTAQTTCFARLPSGSIVEGTPESANGDTDLKFSFPVQTEGTYQFYARIIAADDQRVNRSQWTWKIPADRMFEVGANYPNPFLTTTTIPFMLLKEGHVQADVFSIIGQKVKTLSRDFTVGRHQFRLNLTDFASGVYLVRLHLSSPTGKKNIIKTEKIMRIK